MHKLQDLEAQISRLEDDAKSILSPLWRKAVSISDARTLSRRYAELDSALEQADRIIDDTESPVAEVRAALEMLQARRDEAVEVMEAIDNLAAEAADEGESDVEDALPEYTGDLVAGWDALIETANEMLGEKSIAGAHMLYR